MDSGIKKMLGEILAAVTSLDGRVSKLEEGAAPPPTAHSWARSSGEEAVAQGGHISRAPSDGVQMTLTIAYYLEPYDGVSPFNAAEWSGVPRARETVPININDKANMCVRNGHFMDEKGKKDSMKAWVVTRTGEEVARKGFGKMPS